jgi:uncharacterized protein YhdP
MSIENQKPVAWRYRGNLHEFDPSDWADPANLVIPLYEHPYQKLDKKPDVWLTEERYAQLHTAKREWVGLTHDEMETTHWSPDFRAGAIWAENKLKERNT